MARFDDPALLAAGKVNIISLEAVMQKFESRWHLRQSQVYDHVDRTMQGYLEDRGYFLRVSETDYLICQPELGRFSGQAACLRYLRAILTHFLGEAALADAGVHEVTKISGERVEANPLNAQTIEIAELAEADEYRQAEVAQKSRAEEQLTFVAANGRSIRISCSLDPIYELKAFKPIGFRLVRRVHALDTEEILSPTAIAHLASPDILRIDLATIRGGLARLSRDCSGNQPLSLIIPISYHSLSSQRCRTEVIGCLKIAQTFVQKGIICEIFGIEGVPQCQLLTVVSLIRPFSLFVVGHLESNVAYDVVRLKGSGLRALTLDVPAEIAESDFDAWAQTSVNAARQVTGSVLIYDAKTPRNARAAALLGATHASLCSI